MDPRRGNDRPPVGFLSTELISGVSNGVGFLLSIVALVVLVVLGAPRGGAGHIVACSVYGSTLIILHLAPTL